MNDAQLIEFAAEFRRGIIGRRYSDMMCFAICAPLITLLEMRGTPGALVQSTARFGEDEYNHFWIELRDGRALDPTADQFSAHIGKRLPKVYLGPPLAELHANRIDGQSTALTPPPAGTRTD